jgi:Carboxymuconolactone decarboxylase family
VRPSEISETITHLAFYSGWPNAMSAVIAAKEVFAARGITPATQASPALLPLDEKAEAQRDYCLPGELEARIEAFVAHYNQPCATTTASII